MPLYEYECEANGHRFEVIQKFSDPPPAACPTCGSPVQKLPSSPAIQFKGSGFYLTDYGRAGSKGDSGNVAAGKSGGPSSGDSSSKDKGESKSDGKSESKSDAKFESKSETKSSSSSDSSSSAPAPPAPKSST